MKKGFTLLEINLAVMIMAGGVLSVLGLYGLGYREKRQSREDVAAAAYADAVLSPLVMALSATNATWSSFNSIDNYPGNNGWGEYIDSNGIVSQDPTGMAKNAFNRTVKAVGGNASWPSSSASGGLLPGLVVLHKRDSGGVKIGFRATRHEAERLSMPLFYTEVRFQGPTRKASEGR